MRKLIIALLLLNFVATLTVGYMFYEKSQQDIELTIEVLQPHENGEYESCPECQKHLQENQDKIISNVYIKEQTL